MRGKYESFNESCSNLELVEIIGTKIRNRNVAPDTHDFVHNMP